jgi:CubicO group peptidase (beta-lactamase class C family)
MFANGGKWKGEQLIPTWIMQALAKPLSQATDEVLCVPMAFSAGMMMDPIDPETNQKSRQMFGPGAGAFGHPGAGGSLAFADPDSGISFAYVMNQMEVGVLPGEKALGLVRAVFASLNTPASNLNNRGDSAPLSQI